MSAPPSASDRLRELRAQAARYGLELELLDRLALRPREVAHALGVSHRTVEGWIASGQLAASKPERAVLVSLPDLLAFLDAHRLAPRSAAEALADRAQRFLDGGAAE